MKQITKVVKHGSSFYLKLNKELIAAMNLDEDDLVEIDIKLINGRENISSYRCKVCELNFDMNREEPYCPACDAEGDSLEEIK